MSFGMGFVFVPLTVTAIHGVGEEDSGIGSGVLNAMQQVGGSLGLATLSTVAVAATKDKVSEITAGAQAVLAQGPTAPSADEQRSFMETVTNVAFAHGSTYAFMVGAAMIWVAAVIIFMFMRVSHDEINDIEAPVGMHAG